MLVSGPNAALAPEVEGLSFSILFQNLVRMQTIDGFIEFDGWTLTCEKPDRRLVWFPDQTGVQKSCLRQIFEACDGTASPYPSSVPRSAGGAPNGRTRFKLPDERLKFSSHFLQFVGLL